MMPFLHSKPRWHLLPRFFFHPPFMILIILLIIILILINIPFFPMLVLTDGQTDQVLERFSLQNNNKFSILYIHSIHRTPVQEFYHVDKQLNIVLDKVIFESYGVGIPSEIENGEKFKIENGKFILDSIHRVFPYFDQRVGQVIANHKLLIQNKELPLSKLTVPGHWIRFEATKSNLVQWIKGRDRNES
ncbi:DUF1850 domain-containing protein [Tepidibacillus infernus]|uniref:DUF1850 domain-containing protein n=1 Tax=Tepidibacillus TaxID=1494427 RepID=UPI000852F3C4|nr:DUF1850 domain-containing protein [Tepidibacillus sp. HK-1]GBF12165.1 hypothetical protein HK1_02226 [Tepidibacillus sp. HK-1]